MKPEFRSIYAASQTIYLKDEQLRKALAARPELQRSGTLLTALPEDADLLIEVHRPFLTFDWTYTVKQRGGVLVEGKVVAVDGAAAATKLAAQICEQLYGAADGAASAAAGRWTARYRGGTLAAPVNTRVQLTLADGRFQVSERGKKEVLSSAPIGAVTGTWLVVSKPYRRTASDAWWDSWTRGEASKTNSLGAKMDSLSCGGEDCIGLLMWIPVIVGTGELLKVFDPEQPRQSREAHQISVSWVQDGVTHSGQFQMSSKDIAAFQKALRQLQPETLLPATSSEQVK